MLNHIRSVRIARGMSQAELAFAVQTSRSQIVKLERGERRLTDVWLERLSKALRTTKAVLLGEQALAPYDEPVQHAPLIDWVSAGDMSSATDPYPLGEADEYVPIAFKHNKIIALTAKGDSMDLEFGDGQIIIIDYTDTTLIDRKMYVIRHDGDTTVKMYRANPDRFEPRSTNPVHNTIILQGETEIVGRVVQSVKVY